MKALFLGGLILALPLCGYCWELGITSRTWLSPAGWTEELGVGLVLGPWEVRAGAGFSDTGFIATSLEGRYQTASFSLWGGAEFAAGDFSQGNLGAEVCLIESLGISVEVVVDDAGFAGATLSLWCEAGVAEGSSGFTGLLELDPTGAVVGQTLRFGLDFPPLSLESTAWFDETGFTALELSLELIGEAAAVEVSGNWVPGGLEAVGGSLSGMWDTLVASAEASWMMDGDWVFAAEALFGELLSLRGELSHMGGYHTWGAEIGISWGSGEACLGLGSGDGGIGYAGSLSFMWDRSSLELRGSFSPTGDWELELSLDLSLLLE